MTKDEALKLALKFVEDTEGGTADLEAAIKEALVQPEQEPVAWGVFEGNLHDMFFSQSDAQEMADLKGTHAEVKPLYTAPQSTWVGLTKEERHEISMANRPYCADVMAAHEEELKRRNT